MAPKDVDVQTTDQDRNNIVYLAYGISSTG